MFLMAFEYTENKNKLKNNYNSKFNFIVWNKKHHTDKKTNIKKHVNNVKFENNCCKQISNFECRKICFVASRETNFDVNNKIHEQKHVFKADRNSFVAGF